MVSADKMHSLFSHKYRNGEENGQQAKDLDWSGSEAGCYDSFNARVHQKLENHGLVAVYPDKNPSATHPGVGSVEEVPLDSCAAKHDW